MKSRKSMKSQFPPSLYRALYRALWALIGPYIGPYEPYREGPNAQGLYWGAPPPKPSVGPFRARALMPKRFLE